MICLSMLLLSAPSMFAQFVSLLGALMYFLNVASGLNGLFPSRLNELVVKCFLSIECYLLIVFHIYTYASCQLSSVNFSKERLHNVVSYYQLEINTQWKLLYTPSMVISSCELFLCMPGGYFFTPSTVISYCELFMYLDSIQALLSAFLKLYFLASNFLSDAISTPRIKYLQLYREVLSLSWTSRIPFFKFYFAAFFILVQSPLHPF